VAMKSYMDTHFTGTPYYQTSMLTEEQVQERIQYRLEHLKRKRAEREARKQAEASEKTTQTNMAESSSRVHEKRLSDEVRLETDEDIWNYVRVMEKAPELGYCTVLPPRPVVET